MTRRERVLTALSHREPDRVPIDLSGHRASGIAALAYSPAAAAARARKRGPLISRSMYREFFKQRHALLWRRAHELADVKVMLHSVNGDPKLSNDRSTTQKIVSWFNTSVFTQPAAFTFGNGPRSLPTVRTDGINNVDLSVFKVFPIGEARNRKRVEFRGEAFNAFNRPQFGVPGNSFGGANFGIVGSQRNNPRQMQFSLKFLF